MQQPQIQGAQQFSQPSQASNDAVSFLMNLAKNGNPQQAQQYINSLIANGQLSQEQFNQYKQQAETIGKMLGLI